MVDKTAIFDWLNRELPNCAREYKEEIEDYLRYTDEGNIQKIKDGVLQTILNARWGREK